MLYGLGGMAILFALVSSAFCFHYVFYNDTTNTGVCVLGHVTTSCDYVTIAHSTWNVHSDFYIWYY